MRITILRAIVVLLTLTEVPLAVVGDKSGVKAETPHPQFVSEYIRELGAIEDIRASGEKEFKEASKDEQLSVSIHVSTTLQLELRTQQGMLRDMRLNPPFEDLIPSLVDYYEHKISLHQKLIDISTAFIAAPQQGVEYGKLAAEVPKIRAELEYVDHSLFEAVPLICMTLVDQKPDSKKHLSHLVITRAQKAQLLHDLKMEFGVNLDKKNQNTTVSSASLLKEFLLKDYKCADDPWD